ncbi:unnamed protein product [Cuscuta epithymum]|uniref:ATP synthase F0 subunit 8 n=1 Tax=Cuscuta epithymum TaxID=186058 RepID=A0AAV0DMH1_9ASTE|nr:unnamed protein product [Cuscuta epithymum]CAH9142012.1 unnamed protein product [Cuscuta epithymum]
MLTVTLNFSPFVTLLLLCIFVEVVFLIVILLSRINWMSGAAISTRKFSSQGKPEQFSLISKSIEMVACVPIAAN